VYRKGVGEKISNAILKTKLKQINQFESAIFFRLASGGMLSDGLAWGASIIGFRLFPFIIGYTVTHIITTLPLFYIIYESISVSSWFVGGVLLVVSWLILIRFKGRYLE